MYEQLAQSCYPAAVQPGIQLATSRSLVQRTNHYTTEPHLYYVCNYARLKICDDDDMIMMVCLHAAPWVGQCRQCGTISRICSRQSAGSSDSSPVEQENCAIAKMTAQCALHMGALKIFGTP